MLSFHHLFLPSYKSCLPKIHRHDIQNRNRLDRYLIRNTLKHFLRRLGCCSVDEHSLKLKYLIELASVEPSLGCEVFHVNHSASPSAKEPAFTVVRVSGEAGIQTSGNFQSDSVLVRTNSPKCTLRPFFYPSHVMGSSPTSASLCPAQVYMSMRKSRRI